jgi:hypothetical protein
MGTAPPCIVKIERCQSGVLCPPQRTLWRRVTLATAQAFTALTADRTLQDVLRGEIEASGRVDPQTLAAAGFKHAMYEGNNWQTFGIYYSEETDDYLAAHQRLQSTEPGIHRRVIFAAFGIITTPALVSLPKTEYKALFAWVKKEFKSPTFNSIQQINITQKPFGIMVDIAESQSITFSREQLSAFLYEAKPKLVPIGEK